MFSAIYLVCIMGQPCVSVVEPRIFETVEECNKVAEETKLINQQRVLAGAFKKHTVDHQCISWSKA